MTNAKRTLVDPVVIPGMGGLEIERAEWYAIERLNRIEAAAPELLEALLAWVDLFRAKCALIPAWAIPLLQQSDAVIAKATEG
jgi:hypothetical protein